MESVTIQRKTNGRYVDTYKTTDNVHSRLMRDLLVHYVHKARYIRRVVDRTNYNGTRTVVVYYDNGTRAVYVING